jgi:hypothetical protein
MYRLAVVAALLAGLAGCSGLSALTGPTGAPPQDVCVLTTAEVTNITGWKDLHTRQETTENGGSLCAYVTSVNNNFAANISVTPLTAIACEEARHFEGSIELTGIGEWAYYARDRGNRIFVKLGTNCLEVGSSVGTRNGTDYVEAFSQIARLAASRL